MLKEKANQPADSQLWTEVFLEDITFDARGLVPVVAQDCHTLEVLMLAWANREALELTLQTRKGTYFSRSRDKIWVKGESSGNVQRVQQVLLDCDGDAVIYLLEQEGGACHTGERSCFNNALLTPATAPAPHLGATLERVYSTILDRLEHQPENSYVTKMHLAGLDRILKKIPEEAGEVVIAAKNADRAEMALEVADLFFHSIFAMAELGMNLGDLALELQKREGKTGLRLPKPVG